MGMYYCPNCNADLDDQYGFDPSSGVWTCTECGQFLMDEDVYDGNRYEGVAWYCDNCNALLNRQIGFTDDCGSWTCTECGYTNGTNNEDIIEDEHKCPECGANLKKQWNYSEYCDDYICEECGKNLHRDYSGDEFSVVESRNLCPNCGAILTSQSGYYENRDEWTCDECRKELYRGYSTDDFEIVDGKDKCPSCYSTLLTQIGYDKNTYDWECAICGIKLHRDYTFEEFSIDYSDDESVESNQENNSADEYSSTYQYYRTKSDCRYKEESTNSQYAKSDGYPYKSINQTSNSNYFNHLTILSKGELRRKRIKAFILKGSKISIGYSSSLLQNQVYTEVYTHIYNCGFKRIKTLEIKDVDSNSTYKENDVSKIEIDGRTSFEASDLFSYNSDVVIWVHKKKEIVIPFPASYYLNKDYGDVRKEISSLGFSNIVLCPEYDLVLGWIKKENFVKSIFINDKKLISYNSPLRYDVPIKLIYHSYRKSNPKIIQRKMHIKSLLITCIKSIAPVICIFAVLISVCYGMYVYRQYKEKTCIHPPISSSEMISMNYEELESLLYDSGFEEIQSIPDEDLIVGWINKDGEVFKVSIDGRYSFNVNSLFSPSAQVVIQYHTFPMINEDDSENDISVNLVREDEAEPADEPEITSEISDQWIPIDEDSLVFDYAYFRVFLDYTSYYLIDVDECVVCWVATQDGGVKSFGRYTGNALSEIEIKYSDKESTDTMRFPTGIGNDATITLNSMDITINLLEVPVEEAEKYL